MVTQMCLRNCNKLHGYAQRYMGKEVRFELNEEQHEELSELKDRRGYTWKGLMLEGASCLKS